MHRGYYVNPTISGEKIVFVCEEDLWTVSTLGGEARRLTSGRGGFQQAFFSPDGKWLAVSSAEFGAREVYRMPADGGELERRTWYNNTSAPRGWWKNDILMSTWALDGNWAEMLCLVPGDGGEVRDLHFGPSIRAGLASDGTLVVERNGWRSDSSHWKRYRGGTAGKFYLRAKGAKEFKPFLRGLKGHLTHPMWIGERFYFLSDHDGVANIYSVTKTGSGLKRHTQFDDFYVRNPDCDGRRIVFHSAGDLYVFDPAQETVKRIEVRIPTQRTHRQKKFVSALANFENAALDPQGRRVALTARGQVFAFEAWQGGILSPSQPLEQRSRDRLGTFLDAETLMFVSDELANVNGETLVTAPWAKPTERRLLKKADIGRAVTLLPSPDGKLVALSNHRNEILVIDVATEKVTRVYQERLGLVGDFSWSPDSRYLAYVSILERTRMAVRIWDAKTGKDRLATRGNLTCQSLRFSPNGELLYFLAATNFNPRYENNRFNLYFSATGRPVALLLSEKSKSPFAPADPAPPAPAEETKKKKTTAKAAKKKNGETASATAAPAVKETVIDWEGLGERLVEIPAYELEYSDLFPIEGGLVLTHYRTPGTRNMSNNVPLSLDKYDFSSRKQSSLYTDIDNYERSANGEYILIKKGDSLRLRKVSEAGNEDRGDTGFHPKTGLIDLARIAVPVNPGNEWLQIFEETWRLQAQFFWEKGLGGVDWKKEHAKYRPLVDRVSVRSELSDLCWELVGELGVSHAYVQGGDLRVPPFFKMGYLGGNFDWDEKAKGWRVRRIFKGYPWLNQQNSPMRRSSVQLSVGDVIHAINRRPCEKARTIASSLIGHANRDVELEILRKGHTKTETVVVRTLNEEGSLRYRDWVETRREIVQKLSGGKLGYVHIPDMGPEGYAEFFEQYLQEFDRDGLVVDVRFNGGGHVSQLILSRLLQKRVGVDQSRWFGVMPYPGESPAGPLVALTNEFAGSDGDIFSHTFKLYDLGPLVGMRTWGGVIGIWPRHKLMDGGGTTQPEFAFWFMDTGWDVEGRGALPDIVVDNLPHDYEAGVDRQLEAAVKEALKLVKKNPPFRPKLPPPPRRVHK